MVALADLEKAAQKFSHLDAETTYVGHEILSPDNSPEFLERYRRIRDLSISILVEAAAMDRSRPRRSTGGANHLRQAYVANVVSVWREQIGLTPGSDKGWFRDILAAGWRDLGFPDAGVGDLHETIGAAIKADFRERLASPIG